MSAPDRDPAVEVWEETIEAAAYPTRFVVGVVAGPRGKGVYGDSHRVEPDCE